MADFSYIPTSLIRNQNIILIYNVAQSFTVDPFSFFGMLQNLRKWGKYVTFLICASHFLRFKMFIIENTKYNFCIFNNLQFKRDHEKSEN